MDMIYNACILYVFNLKDTFCEAQQCNAIHDATYTDIAQYCYYYQVHGVINLHDVWMYIKSSVLSI